MRNGPRFHLDVATAAAHRLRARCAAHRLNGERWHRRAARRNQAARSAQESQLDERVRRHASLGATLQPHGTNCSARKPKYLHLTEIQESGSFACAGSSGYTMSNPSSLANDVISCGRADVALIMSSTCTPRASSASPISEG